MKRSFVFRSGILLGFVANFTFAADRGDIVDRNGATIVSGSGADRDYPVAEAAAHVTGYCESNEGGQGVVGIEKMANDELARGETVKLNIDLRFQNAVYAQLKESGRSGTAVVIDPRNGEVLALCSYPSYDPKRFTKGISKEGFEELRDSSEKHLYTRALGGQPPASTFKTFTSLALERAAKDGTQHCNGTTVIGDKVYRCWKRDGHGRVSGSKQALRRSCNCYYYQAVSELTLQDLSEVAGIFGFGKTTGIELSDSSGQLPSKALGSNIATACIGHGHTVATPLQIAIAYAAIANGQVRYRPQLIAGKEPEIAAKLADAGLKPEHLEEIKQALIEVVEHSEGTGRRARIDGLRIAGKTGSSTISDNRSLAIFAGYAPVDDPRFAICVVQYGRKGEPTISGGTVAAPLAAQILKEIDQAR